MDAIFGVTAEVRDLLFADAPAGDGIWIGEIYFVDPGREVIPFQFGLHRYLALFSSPIAEAGDADAVADMAPVWAGGYLPAQLCRVIKFCRADAQVDPFKPDGWKLDETMQIFEFSQLLGDVVVLHSGQEPPMEEYFFWPANQRLLTLYRRVFRRINRSLLAGRYEPILEHTGEFHGYARAQVV